jgi:hypothetical protein
LFDSAGNLRQDVPIFVDGRNPRLSGQGLDVRLDSDAVISFFFAHFQWADECGGLEFSRLRHPGAK